MTRSNQRGMALLSILVVVGIISVIVMVFLKRLDQAQRRTQSLQLQGEFLQVRKHVNNRIDCSRIPQTFHCALGGLPQSNCNNNRIPLYSQGGAQLVGQSAQGTLLARGLRVRACCSAGSLRLEARRVDAAGSLKKDPFRETLTYNWVDIFEEEGSPCDFYDKNTGDIRTAEGITIVKTFPVPFGVGLSLWAGVSLTCPGYGGELGGPPETYFEASGTATCPTGYLAVAGGAACETLTLSPLYGSFGQLHDGGFQKSSSVTADGKSWRSSCCLATNAMFLPFDLLAWPDKIKAVCVRQ